MRYGSVCSGIEAATAAWHPIGWTPAWFAEVEPFPSAVLAHHYPAVPNLGDITAPDFTERAKEYGPIDVLVGGTPCQSFSVAGLRGGMADPRGNLALVFLAIADRLRPAWVVWENVPGVLSSNGGRDFGSILGGLAELGYGFAYRVLDAQYFGVPQRRRRVFVVGYLGDWRRAAAVLFERDCLSGNPAPRRETGARVAGGTDDCVSASGDVAPLITARETGKGWWTDDGLASLRSEPGGMPENIVAFDTTQITSASNYSNPRPGDPCHPIAAGAHAPAVAYALGSHAGAAGGDQTNRSHASGGPVGMGISEEMAHSLRGGRTQTVAYAVAMRGRDGETQIEMREDGIANALRTPSGGRSGEGIGAALVGSAVRRLTPRECERLQGLPDDFTAVPFRGKPAADWPRYWALGNSMAVPVMRWIGERIAATAADARGGGDVRLTDDARRSMVTPTTERASARGAETPSGTLGSPSDDGGGEP